jgi:glycosyltransferase involved in cell wall biosynthesis
MPRHAIVVPCYNEATRFSPAAFVDNARQTPNRRFVFVDDGSTDATWDVLRDTAAALPAQLEAVQQHPNAGKAEAVRTGVLHAIEDPDTDWVGYFDADLATPLDALDQMMALFDAHAELELVLAARVQLLGRHIDRNPTRHYAGRVFATAASTLLAMPIYDTQCGAKLFRVTDLLRIAFAERFVTSWTFDVELLSRLAHLREGAGLPPLEAVTHELPLTRWTDVAGSKVRAKDFPLALRDLGRIWWNHRGGYRRG